jgi:hypothetical protein
MRLVDPLLFFSLLVFSKEKPRHVWWIVDGNKLKCMKGAPSTRSEIAERLNQIPRNQNGNVNLALIFDGRRGENGSICEGVHDNGNIFRMIVTSSPQSADDYIGVQAIENDHFFGSDDDSGVSTRLHLISADLELSQRVRQTNKMSGGAQVNPIKF